LNHSIAHVTNACLISITENAAWNGDSRISWSW